MVFNLIGRGLLRKDICLIREFGLLVSRDMMVHVLHLGLVELLSFNPVAYLTSIKLFTDHLSMMGASIICL